MKKILALLLAVSMVFALVACSKPAEKKEEEKKNTVSAEVEVPEGEAAEGETAEDEAVQDGEGKSEAEDADKQEEAQAPEDKPAAKPEDAPAAKPEEKPAEQPQDTPAANGQSVGSVLWEQFKKEVVGEVDMVLLAEKLVQHESIPFMGGASAVEPGLLAGFGNTEIKGFKSGASFMPMIGSIAFIGYVFELEDGTDASAFVSTLKQNADLRWNVCVEAEEMVANHVGNKVFFVMCPKQFEE